MGGTPPRESFLPHRQGRLTRHCTFINPNPNQASRRLNLVLHADDAADALPLCHQVEGLVDLREWDAVRDELLHLQLLRANKAES